MIDKSKLIEVAKELNESGLLDELIDLSLGTNDLTAVFVKKVKAIPDDLEPQIPDNVINVYNDLVTEMKKKEKSSVATSSNRSSSVKSNKSNKPKSIKENKMKKVNKKKEVKKPAAKKEKKEVKKNTVKKESNASKMDAMMKKGGVTIEQMVKAVGCKASSARNHIQDLRKKGTKITNVDGKFSMKG